MRFPPIISERRSREHEMSQASLFKSSFNNESKEERGNGKTPQILACRNNGIHRFVVEKKPVGSQRLRTMGNRSGLWTLACMFSIASSQFDGAGDLGCCRTRYMSH